MKWDNERIIGEVDKLYPGQTRKNVQTLISRYRKLLRQQEIAREERAKEENAKETQEA